jgi:hypothetical protein
VDARSIDVMPLHDVSGVQRRLQWMRERGIWPNGPRYLWTDAFGILVLLSLHRELGDERRLDEARWVAAEVDRVLGRPRGYRIGEEPDRDGQYFHYLAMWIYALTCLGRIDPAYRAKAIGVVRDVHDSFVVPGVGVHWKMKEDLSAPYPGFGLGAIDPFHGYVVYRLLAERELAREVAEMAIIIENRLGGLDVTQDLGLGIMLWLSHFFPREKWATTQRQRALRMLDRMWIDPPGYFCRELGHPEQRIAFSNYGVGVGLSAVHMHEERVHKMHAYFDAHPSGDDAITHVMACASHLPGVLLRPRERMSAVSGW